MAEAPPAPTAPKKGKSALLIILLAVLGLGACGITAILAAILFPVFSQAKLAAQKTRDLSTAKELALAAIIYATDHDEQLPIVDNWQEALTPLLASTEGSSALTFATGAGSPFAFQPLLSGAALPLIEAQDITAMICPDGFPPSVWEQDQYTVVAFVDGSAKAIKKSSPEDFDEIAWEPTLLSESEFSE